MNGRYINLMNYPHRMGHVVAEVYYSGRWNLDHPTYNAFYLRLDDDSLHPLSFEELRSLYFNSPEKVSIISNTYRDKKESFTGADIFNNSNQTGAIGPDRPQHYPLSIHLKRTPVLEFKDIGLAYQGANYSGAAGINQNHRWTIDGLTPDENYVFVVHPGNPGGDLVTSDRSFDLIFSMTNGSLLTAEHISIDFSVPPVTPVEIPFQAHEKSVALSLSHPYQGPDYRYFYALRYEIKQLNKD